LNGVDHRLDDDQRISFKRCLSLWGLWFDQTAAVQPEGEPTSSATVAVILFFTVTSRYGGEKKGQ
jgi:hypothetical protein